MIPVLLNIVAVASTDRMSSTPAAEMDWSAAAEDYDRMTPFTMKFAADCAEALKIPKNLNKEVFILDVAAGTGSFALSVASQCVAGDGGRILATDISPGMIEVMKLKAKTQLSPEQQSLFGCAVMDGQNLDVPDASISHLGCVFGLMFFPDRIKGIKEIYRVLQPGGAACIAVWQKSSFLSNVEAIALREGKSIPEQLTKMVYCYADENVLKGDLMIGGFRESDITVTCSHHEHEFLLETMLKSTASNPATKQLGLSKESMAEYFASVARPERPDHMITSGIANIVLAKKPL